MSADFNNTVAQAREVYNKPEAEKEYTSLVWLRPLCKDPVKVRFLKTNGKKDSKELSMFETEQEAFVVYDGMSHHATFNILDDAIEYYNWKLSRM